MFNGNHLELLFKTFLKMLKIVQDDVEHNLEKVEICFPLINVILLVENSYIVRGIRQVSFRKIGH